MTNVSSVPGAANVDWYYAQDQHLTSLAKHCNIQYRNAIPRQEAEYGTLAHAQLDRLKIVAFDLELRRVVLLSTKLLAEMAKPSGMIKIWSGDTFGKKYRIHFLPAGRGSYSLIHQHAPCLPPPLPTSQDPLLLPTLYSLHQR